MQSWPRICFAIPFFRDVELLARAVDSVRAQTLGDWELVVMDDAGPVRRRCGAAARDLVEGLGDRRAARYVRHRDNAGLAGNWNWNRNWNCNRCLDVATSPLDTLLHADDELCSAPATPSSSWRVTADIHWQRGQYVFCPSLAWVLGNLHSGRFELRWRIVMDLAFMSEVLLAGGALVGTPHVAYRYRRHGEVGPSAVDAIQPWRFQSWILPRDPDFAVKAARVLDLYQQVYSFITL